jgi:[protein-PII] uridylyltransferase
LDVFYVQDMGGSPFGCDNARNLDRLVTLLEAAARGETPMIEAKARAELGRAAAFSISASVVIDNDASEESTVIEASGRDRPGLLADLSRALAQAELSIQSAHIDAYGERAIDAFYVHDAGGQKLTDAKALQSLKSALLLVLEEDEAGAQVKGRLRLQRARASVGR